MSDRADVKPVLAAEIPAVIRLAEFVSGFPIDPSRETVSLVRNALLDVMGCIVMGASQAVSAKAQSAFASKDAGLSTIYGTDLTAPADKAALLNAVSGHSMDFDDWELPGNTHPTVVMVPAILAAASGRAYSGRQVVESYIAGFEVIARLGEAVNFDHYDAGWHSTATLGTFGAAAAVSRLWGLSKEQTVNALSIAASRATGFTCQFGSNAKPLQAGFAAEAGYTAALLAYHGLTGQSHVLDAPRGFNALTAHGDSGRFASTFDKLGASLALDEHGIVFKIYPSCGYTHRIVDCALDLRQRGMIDPSEIVRISLHSPDFHSSILPFMQPTNRTEALFSLPFCASLAFLSGNVTLGDFDQRRWNEPEIRALVAKTSVHPYAPQRPDCNYAPEDPDRMEVETIDGQVHLATIVYPQGSPQNPASDSMIVEKFCQNLEIGLGTRPSDGYLDQLINWPEANDIIGLLSGLEAKS